MSKAANEVRVYLQNLVGKSWRPLPAVAKALPDDIHEQVSEEYGGLKNFFQSNPQLFELELQQSVFSVRLRPVKIPQAPPLNTSPVGTQQRPKGEVQLQTLVPIPAVVEQPPSNAPPIAADAFSRIPTFSVLVSTIAEAENRPFSEVMKDLRSFTEVADITEVNFKTFVTIKPEWKSAARKWNTTTAGRNPDTIYKDHNTPDYEAFRISRFLSTSDFLGFKGIEVAAAGVITSPLENVIAAFPDLFEVSPEGVRFRLDRKYWKAPETSRKCDEELSGKSIEELEQLLRLLTKNKQEYSFGKLMKRRKELIHRLQLKKFPMGNVLQDERVLAYLMFDLLPADSPIPLTALKEKLPDNARFCANPSPKLMEKFPHLFFTFQQVGATWMVQRPDLPRPQIKGLDEVTDDDIICSVISALPRNFDPERPICVSDMIQTLEFLIRQKVESLGGWQLFLKKHPESFQLVGNAAAMMVKVIDPRLSQSK
jgi:hypothetical protein